MINNPSVIFMDEPVSALDPIGRRDVVEIIQSLKDTTVIFSTHILADVENLCDYILIIEKGKIMAQDTMANLKERYSTGTAKINFYHPDDAKVFRQQINDSLCFTALQQANPTEVFLQSKNGNMQELSYSVTNLLNSHEIAIESFGANSPHLEDIFYEVINK
jgi:ABC-2 type transport system ATP-binding protein